MTNPLRVFFDARKPTDRGIWKWNHYLDVYHRHLAAFRSRQITMLEIGVLDGGGLDMWRAYFNDPAHRDVGGKGAFIHGVDIHPDCNRPDQHGVRVHIGDQADPVFWDGFKKEVPVLDVVIDDGGHEAHQQAASFNALFDHLSPGGVYIIEDMETNAFMEQLLRVMWEMQAMKLERSDDSERALVSIANPVQQKIASVSVYPGIVVVQKTRVPVGEFVAPWRGNANR